MANPIGRTEAGGVGTGISMDAHELTRLAEDLWAGARNIDPRASYMLIDIGKQVQTKARNKASSDGSLQIPPTIRGGLVTPHEYRIEAGGESVPIAGLWELGNRGGSERSTTFRHPVWGNKNVWVEQNRYPYLQPALRETEPMIWQRADMLWPDALGPYDLMPTFG